MPENVSLNLVDYKGVTLINIDELYKITDETLSIRQREIPFAEAIIETHKNEFNDWQNQRKYTPTITALKNSLENIKNDEIKFQRKKIPNFDEHQAEIISSRIIKKITTQFVKHLKEEGISASQSIQVINKVFQS